MTWLAALAALASIGGTARVVDGDTLRIGDLRVRLYGIDAPELHQLCGSALRRTACGQEAAAWLRSAVDGADLTCEAMDVDRYGRTVAICRQAGRDLGEQLVSAGLALAYRRYSTRYVTAEDSARAARRGMWSGDFETPSDFRAKQRAVHVRRAGVEPWPQRACTIKGNISSKGVRIFHVPGGRDYAKVVISARRGERWFCSEAEARAAGWRPSR